MERTWVKRNEYQIYLPEDIWDEALGQETELLGNQDVFKTQWAIIVGEPGIGKTHALRQEYEGYKRTHPDDQVIFLDLKGVRTWREFKERVFQQPFFEKWVEGKGNLALFLDHVDESIAKDTEFEGDLCDYHYGCGDLFLVHEHRHRLILRMAVQPCFEATELIYYFKDCWFDEEEEGEKGFFEVYQLLPYREPEVAELLKSKGLEAKEIDRFLQAVWESNAASFAFKPEPLKMLIELDLQGNRDFPQSLPELYEQACQRLCPNESLEKLSRIAADLVFTNRSVPDPKLDEELLSHPDLIHYLAARWACRHLNTEQMLQLIAHPLGNGKIVPQLHQTAAWMASRDEEIFEPILEADPNVLFSIPLNCFSENQREKLVRKFLETAKPKDLVYKNVNFTVYPYFKYAGLANLLRPFLSSQREEFTRLLAMDIARECKLTELAEDSLHLAFHEQKSEKVRLKAIQLYFCLTRPEEWKKCKPLIKDKEGLPLKMRTVILTKLWKYNQLSVSELIEVAGKLCEEKENVNLKEVFATNDHHQLIALFHRYLKEKHPSVALERIIDQSFLYGLNFLHLPEMREVLLALISRRYHEGKQIGDYSGSGLEEHLRRKWIVVLLDPEAVFDLSQSDLQKEDFHQILLREQDRLFFNWDRDWLVKQLEISGHDQKTLLKQQLEKIKKGSIYISEIFSKPLLLPDEMFEKVKKEVETLEISDEKIVSFWPSFSSWEVLIDPSPRDQEVTKRLYQIPEVREKLITAAKRFLSLCTLPEKELLENSSPHVIAGRMSFRILSLLCPEELQKLPDSVWKAWRTLFVYPDSGYVRSEQVVFSVDQRIRLAEMDRPVIRLAIEKIPGELEERFFQLVDSVDRFVIIKHFCQMYWSPSLEAGLFERLRTGKLSLDQFKYALYYLLKNESKPTEEWADSLLNHWNAEGPISRETMAIVAYCVLITRWDDQSWNQVLNLMFKDVSFGKEMITTFRDNYLVDDYIYLPQKFPELNEKTLERIYRWLSLYLDQWKTDDYFYNWANRWKEWILIALRHQKTIPAYETIKRKVEEYPSDSLADQYWQWCETDYLYKTWVPEFHDFS